MWVSWRRGSMWGSYAAHVKDYGKQGGDAHAYSEVTHVCTGMTYKKDKNKDKQFAD